MTTFIITDLKVNTDCEQLQQLDYTAQTNPGGDFDIWRRGKKSIVGDAQIRPGIKLARSTKCARSKCGPWSWWGTFGSKTLPDLVMTEVLQRIWTDLKVNNVRRLKIEMKWQKHAHYSLPADAHSRFNRIKHPHLITNVLFPRLINSRLLPNTSKLFPTNTNFLKNTEICTNKSVQIYSIKCWQIYFTWGGG